MYRVPFVLITLLLCCVSPLHAQDTTGLPFEQDGMPDGVVCFEAEHYHGKHLTNGYDWVTVLNGSASGGTAVQVLPNLGTNNNSNYEIHSPRLDYRVHFKQAGTHYIVLRGYGPTYNDDSCHSGIDGTAPSTSDRMYGFNNGYKWSGNTYDSMRAQFNVPSTGEHTIHIWMREDGFVIDKILLTVNSNFVPNGFGPPESSHLGEDPATTQDEDAVMVSDISMSNGMIQISVTPQAAADAYETMVYDQQTGSLTNDQSSPFFGYSSEVDPSGSEVGFFAVNVVPLNTNLALGYHVLNRLAYGPTPDELDRVVNGPTPIGPDAYIQEQLSPELITETIDSHPIVDYINGQIISRQADVWDLRAWYSLRAIGAKRQLHEVLAEFFDNHFNTYYWKLNSWFRNQGYSNTDAYNLAGDLEYREMEKWREALLNPFCTFYDLLKISAESPAMIIYLDTDENVKEEPNENYSREIMELFCMGVDNGYDQDDIEAMAPAWTGWTLNKVHPADVGNPHAALMTNDVVLFDQQSTNWLYREGTSEPDAAWRQIGFAGNSNWMTGQTSIGYGDDDDNTVITNMRYNYSSIYLRNEFQVSNSSNIPIAQLDLYVDDGCVVWINEQEVARVRVTEPIPAFDDFANDDVNNPSWESMIFTNASSILQDGTNVIAIHVMNDRLQSSDLSIDVQLSLPGIWSFVFDPSTHETTNKVIFEGKMVDGRFGTAYSGTPYQLALPERTDTNGIADGYDIIEHLANLPQTQEFIITKLCKLFVHEDFAPGYYFNITGLGKEGQLVRDCMTAWNTLAGDGRKGNIRAVLQVIFASDLFRSQKAMRQKVKTPFEYCASVVRSVRADLAGYVTASGYGYDFDLPMEYMGMELFARDFPDGWPEEGVEWIDTGTINERLRFVQHFMMRQDDSLKQEDYGWSSTNLVCDPVALLQDRLPGSDWSDAGAVADFFLGNFFPDEGWANLDLDYTECIDLLNSDSSGVTNSSPFSSLSTSSQSYDERVRSLVGLLLASPKFHEQ